MSSITKVKPTPQIAFVFTGQGAQWPSMTKELLQDIPEFRNDIRALDEALTELPDSPSWTIEREIVSPFSKSYDFLTLYYRGASKKSQHKSCQSGRIFAAVVHRGSDRPRESLKVQWDFSSSCRWPLER